MAFNPFLDEKLDHCSVFNILLKKEPTHSVSSKRYFSLPKEIGAKLVYLNIKSALTETKCFREAVARNFPE